MSLHARVQDHRLYLFFPFCFDAGQASVVEARLCQPLGALTVADLAGTLALPDTVRQKALQAGRGKPLWTQTGMTVREDFCSQIKTILVGPDPLPPEAGRDDLFLGTKPWSLSADAVNLLSGALGTKGTGLTLAHTETGRERSGQDTVQIRIGEGRVFLFGTGIGLLLLGLTVESRDGDNRKCLQPTVPELQEALYALGRQGKRAATLTWEGEGKTTLDAIVQTLVPESGSPPFLTFRRSHRVFHYLGVRLAAPFGSPEDAEHLAYRLSKKYTQDYHPTAAAVRTGVYRPFENIVHGLALEGGVVVVTPDATGAAPTFITDFLTDSFRGAYLQIALIARHEYEFLVDMSQDQNNTAPTRYDSPSEHAIISLRRFREALLDFRMNYRFSHLSHVDVHNEVFARWRETMSLDKMLAEVSADVREVDAYLAQRHHDFREKAIREQSAYGVLVTSAIFLATIFGMNFTEFGGGSGWHIYSPGFYGLGALFVVLAVTLFGIRRARRDFDSKAER